MKKKLIYAAILTGLLQQSNATEFRAIIQLDNVETGNQPVLVGWYPYLESNCTSSGVSTFPDLASWESAGSIICSGSDKTLPTIGDLTSINGLLSIGSSGDYYNLTNDAAFSGLTSAALMNLYLEGKGFSLNSFTTKNPIVNKNLNLYIKDLEEISLTDVDNENITIAGQSTKSKVNTINLDLAKTKASTVQEVTISDVSDTTIKSLDSTLSNYILSIIDSNAVKLNLTNSGVDMDNLIDIQGMDTHIKSVDMNNSYISGDVDLPAFDYTDISKNNIDSMNYENGGVWGLVFSNVSNVGDLNVKDLEYRYLAINGESTGAYNSSIGDITFNNVITSAPLALYDIKDIGNIRLENLNDFPGGENNYFGLSFEPVWGDSSGSYGDIDSLHVLNTKGMITGTLNYFNNVGYFTLDNYLGGGYFDFDLFEDMGKMTVVDSNIGNYIQVNSKNIGDVDFTNSQIDNFVDLIVTESIGNTTFDNVTMNNNFTINAVDSGNVSLTDVYINNYLEIDVANSLNTFTATRLEMDNYISMNNVETIVMNDFKNENWGDINTDNTNLDLSLTMSDVMMNGSSGYFRIQGYDNVKNITVKDSFMNMGIFVNLSNTTGSGDIDEITFENIENNNGYGHELVNINSLNTLNIINNQGFAPPIIKVSGLNNGISNINITNTHSDPVVIGDFDKTFASNLSSISHNDNLAIGLMTVLDGEDPAVTKISNSSVFCTNYGVSTFVYTSLDFSDTNTGTLVDKSYICQ